MLKYYFSVVLLFFLLVALVQAVPEGRIVAGLTSMTDQFSYQVSVKLNGGHFCGGSIISQNYILTAAHCVFNRTTNDRYEISSLAVQAGTTHRANGGIRIAVNETIVHPNYIGDKHADIALLRLASPLTFSRTIRPIELASDDVPENSTLVISGWGSLSEHGAVPNQLQWTTLQTLSKRSCDVAVGYNSKNLLCLAHPKGTGACYGDSGGPAVDLSNLRLVGVASFVLKECGTARPDVYVKVSRYLDWIKSHSDVEDLNFLELWLSWIMEELLLKTQSYQNLKKHSTPNYNITKTQFESQEKKKDQCKK